MTKLEKRKQTLITYLLSQVDAGDWHAVSDCANDIRELEVEIKIKDALAIYLPNEVNERIENV